MMVTSDNRSFGNYHSITAV